MDGEMIGGAQAGGAARSWRLPDASTLASIVLAATLWFLLFSPATQVTRTLHGRYFWIGMSVATTLLGATTLVLQRRSLGRLFRVERRMLVVGVLHAIFLYGLSRLGVWIMATFFAWVVPQIQAIYATRSQLDPAVIALLLLVVIAPFEEVFWRGLVLDRLLGVTGPRVALGISVALYCLVHLPAQNPMLLVAALVLGAHWSYLYYRFRSLVPGLVSHVVWDVAIFVILPIHF